MTAQEQFNRQARQYNERWASWSDETLRWMLETAAPQPDWHALDIATGTGFTAIAFAEFVAHVDATDIAAGMLTEAKRRAEALSNIAFHEAPADAQPFPDATFDLVTCRIAPHHFPDVAAFLREAARVLKPGGAFVLADTTVPDDDPEAAEWQNTVEKVRDRSHVANRTPSQWRAMTTAAGLTVTHCDHQRGAITIPLTAWIETAGCDAEQADAVRACFATAPASAREQFDIRTNAEGETHFAWQRVALRAVK